MRFMDKLMGKSDEQQLQDKEEKHYKFMKEQHTADIAVANESLDQHAQDQRSDLLKWQQDLDDEIIKLRHRLKSEVKYDDDTWGPKMIPVGRNEAGEVIFEEKKPLANDTFMDDVEPQVEPFMSRNLFSSNLNEKRILEMLRNTCNEIADAMSDNFDKYGIIFTNYDMVMRLIKNTIIPGPFRALNDGQRRHDRTIAKRFEAFSEKDVGKPKKKTLMGVDLQ